MDVESEATWKWSFMVEAAHRRVESQRRFMNVLMAMIGFLLAGSVQLRTIPELAPASIPHLVDAVNAALWAAGAAFVFHFLNWFRELDVINTMELKLAEEMKRPRPDYISVLPHWAKEILHHAVGISLVVTAMFVADSGYSYAKALLRM